MSVPATRASTALIRDLEEAGALTPTHLDLSGYPSVTLEMLEALASFLGELSDSTRWWIADLLNFTEMRYAEYVAHIADFTGLAEQTIENYISVGRRIPPNRRRRGVKFSTHAEVAALPPNDQLHWLKVAADERLTKGQLRARLKPELPPAVPSEAALLSARVVELENALQRIYWMGCNGAVEEIIIGVLTPEQRAMWAKHNKEVN